MINSSSAFYAHAGSMYSAIAGPHHHRVVSIQREEEERAHQRRIAQVEEEEYARQKRIKDEAAHLLMQQTADAAKEKGRKKNESIKKEGTKLDAERTKKKFAHAIDLTKKINFVLATRLLRRSVTIAIVQVLLMLSHHLLL